MQSTFLLQVMFRINFVVVILCLVMNRPYQFYYFVPLVSFWYTVMHVTLVLPPRITRPAHANSEASPFNYLYSIIKFIGLGGFITVLFLSEVGVRICFAYVCTGTSIY